MQLCASNEKSNERMMGAFFAMLPGTDNLRNKNMTVFLAFLSMPYDSQNSRKYPQEPCPMAQNGAKLAIHRRFLASNSGDEIFTVQ